MIFVWGGGSESPGALMYPIQIRILGGLDQLFFQRARIKQSKVEKIKKRKI